MILAGVLLKMGTYGFIRFSLPLLPQATLDAVPWMVTLSIIAIVYAGLVTLVQKDMKKLVAYSSVSHLGFCMLGMFALNPLGLEGSVLQMVNHGLSTGGLFLIVGMLYERRHTQEIAAVRRPRARDAGLRDAHARALPRLDGPAAAERLRRRVHDPAGRLRGEPRLGLLGGLGRRAGRRVHAVALPARVLGQARRTRRTRSSRTSTAASSRRSCRSWCSASGSGSTRSRSSISCTSRSRGSRPSFSPASSPPAPARGTRRPGRRRAVRRHEPAEPVGVGR